MLFLDYGVIQFCQKDKKNMTNTTIEKPATKLHILKKLLVLIAGNHGERRLYAVLAPSRPAEKAEPVRGIEYGQDF